MIFKIVIGQQPTLLPSQSHLIIYLFNTLFVKITFCHEHKALSGKHAEQSSVDDSYLVIKEEERHSDREEKAQALEGHEDTRPVGEGHRLQAGC